jgi:hypothetical protein
LRPAADATPDEPEDNLVASVEVVADRNNGVGVPGFAKLPNLTQYGIPAYEGTLLGPVRHNTPNHVRGKKLTPSVHIASVVRSD